MSDASSGGGYKLPSKKVVKTKAKVTAVGQRGPTVAPKPKARKVSPTKGVRGTASAGNQTAGVRGRAHAPGDNLNIPLGVSGRSSSTGRRPVVRIKPLPASPFPSVGPPQDPIRLAAQVMKNFNKNGGGKALAAEQKPVDTGASKSITQVAENLPKGIMAAGAAGSEAIRRLQRSTDISRGGTQQLGGPNIGEAVARNAVKDTANVVVNAIPSTVHIAGEAIHDPGKALHDLAQPYVDLVKHPLKTLTEKPVSSALLVTGPLRGASRGVGAVARRGALGKAAKAGASTERQAATTVEPTKIVEPRRHSPDPVGKGVQVFREKRRLKKIAKANRQADELAAQGHHAEAAALRNEAARSHPARVSEDQVKRRVDELVGVNETVRRRHAGQVDQAVDRAVRNRPTVKMTRKARRAQRVKPTAAVSLTGQNIDFKTYLADLEHAYEHGDLTPREKASNRQARAQVQEALDHPQDPALIQAAADAYRGVERPITNKLVKYKMLDPEEAAKRRELPFAVQSLKAVRDAKPRLTAEGTQRLVIGRRIEEAKKTLAATDAPLRKAHEALSEAEGRAAVLSRNVTGTRAGERAGTAGGGLGVAKAQEAVAKATAARSAAQSVYDDLRGQGKRLKKATKGKPSRKAPGFVDEHGNPLTTAQIRAERLSGAEDAVTGKLTRTPVKGEPAYVSHMPGLLKGGSFFRDSARPVSTGKKPFTGATVTKTGFDASPDALHASARRLQSLVDAHEGHLRVLDEMSLRDKKGKAVTGTREQVQAAIDKATLDHRGDPKPGSRNYRVVRIHPFGARASQLDELVNQLNRHGEMVSNAKGEHNPVIVAMEDALAGKGDGPFAAIPEEAAVRLEQHLRVLGSSGGGHVWQALNTLWRKNVLAFSPKWATSNVVEASVRSLIAGVRPGDRALLQKTVDQWMKEDPDAAEAFLGQLGTGHYGFVNRTQRHATAEEFMDPARHGPFVRNMARIAGTINRTPVINWVPKAWSAWTSHVMDSMGRVEGQFKLGLAGKKIRDLHQESRAFADTSEQAVKDALQGLKGTPSQIETARFATRLYGRYDAYPPGFRQWVAQYTPFVAWTWNAVKFIFDVLPRDHPVVTALMADLVNSQEKWLRDVGLWIGERNTLPSYMLGDIPAGGGLLNVAKYTPASLLQDPIATVGSAILPSMTNLLMASKGLDPFGKPLKESKESAVLKGLLGFMVPAPVLSPGSSGILERLNPVQVIPKERVKYARVKATLDRIQQQITAMPPEQKTKPYSKTYRALLDEQSSLMAERNGLLVKAGLKTDPAISVREPLRLLRRQIRDFPAKDKVDQYGYQSKTYAGLKSAEAQLGAVVTALSPAKKKPTTIRRRPLSTGDQVRKSVQDLRKRDVRQEVLDEIARLREQAKVNSGG